MSRRGVLRVLAVAATVVGGVGGWLVWRAVPSDPLVLPADMRIEDLATDLSASFTPAAVVQESVTAPVTLGTLTPGRRAMMDAHGDTRSVILAPPVSAVRFRAPVGPGSALHFGVGVNWDGQRDESAAGFKFAVTVDGRQAYRRELNPAARGRDRRWFDERIPLAVSTPREVELVFSTSLGRGARAAGTPGWSHLRIVHETTRARAPATSAPNVLVLLVDTLRADAVGTYGATPNPTPHLDALAAGGLVFEQGVAQAPWTMPAVGSIFTGLHPRSHGVIGRAENAPVATAETDPTFLPDALPTLARLAQEAGITTFGVSANPLIAAETNFARGFETFVELPWDAEGSHWARATEVNRAFLAWVAHNQRYRFFAYLHYMDVHQPYRPEPEHMPAPVPDLPPAILHGNAGAPAQKINTEGGPLLPADQLDYLRSLYTACIRSWDDALGALLAELERTGLRSSTIILVVADHGEEFQEHGRLMHSFHLYDELIHVPFVLVGPGLAPGRVALQAQHIDLLPTLGGLLGLTLPADLPGQDLLHGPAARLAFSETRYGLNGDNVQRPMVSVRSPVAKAIHVPMLASTRYFDLRRDAGEQTPGPSSDPALLSALQAFLTSAPAPPPSTHVGPHLENRLRALGYVQ